MEEKGEITEEIKPKNSIWPVITILAAITAIIVAFILIMPPKKEQHFEKQIQTISKHIKENKIDDAKEQYKKLKEIYSKLSKEAKEKYYEKIKPLLDKLSETKN